MENIRFGKPEATDAEVINAAKQANAHRFITGFPDGYKTVVGKESQFYELSNVRMLLKQIYVNEQLAQL